MEAFITRKKRKSGPETSDTPPPSLLAGGEDEESTDLKLAMLSSLHVDFDQETLLDLLLAHDGSVPATSQAIKAGHHAAKKPTSSVTAQASLRSFGVTATSSEESQHPAKRSKLLSRKGATLHLYDPHDIAEHTPCTIIHNFLPQDLANELLVELLEESKTFEKITFKLFDNVVSSPHTSSFYVGSLDELNAQKFEYTYNGSKLTDVRQITPHLDLVKPLVASAVNREITRRITTHQAGQLLPFQSPHPWTPNAAFVNCYNGPTQNVGWHSDQLTYLGPRAVIGSLSLGVAREFRVRRVLPPDEGDGGDAQGQIAIHLPHNSLLVMHAEMQEAWKHCVAPAAAIEPHPVAGNRRINVTYRDYRPEFHPRHTPRCGCDVPCVLRVVQRKRENFGKYFWMCHAGNIPGKEACTFFQWAEFDEEGRPIKRGKMPATAATTKEPRTT
ncbi:GRF zinc finger protein [Podospora conica]|nr:GRF zinc finger protein [Schizothecium conicum]